MPGIEDRARCIAAANRKSQQLRHSSRFLRSISGGRARRFRDNWNPVQYNQSELHVILAREVEAMPYAKYSPEEVESRGEEIYDQQIRQKVEVGNKGKFVVIDIETGEY